MALSALQSSQDARLMALRQKHAQLSETVEREQRSPGSMDADLRFLKRQKLMLKEQIEGIRARA